MQLIEDARATAPAGADRMHLPQVAKRVRPDDARGKSEEVPMDIAKNCISESVPSLPAFRARRSPDGRRGRRHSMYAFCLLLLVTMFACVDASAQTCPAGRTCLTGTGPEIAVAVSGRINVAPDTPVGAPVSSEIPLAPYTISVVQSGAPSAYAWFNFFVEAGKLAPGFSDVYTTNLPGIGVRYFFDFPAAGPSLAATTAGRRTTQNGYLFWETHPPSNGGPWSVNLGRSAQFINLTSGSKSGAVTTIPYIRTDSRTSDTGGNTSFTQVGAYNGMVTGGTISARTCALQPLATIAFPEVPARELPSVGSTAAPRNFTIAANCSEGLVFSLRFSAATSFENASISLLKNTLMDATAAVGYGIQVVEGSTGAVIDATTKRYETTVDSTSFQQAFTAHYYRFGATPAGGRIQSTLIYTLDYY
ncbi:fimbrial protein [Lysobacter sp. S4-A87]|uniref:fimbrial protein n=1 Tax=Lysobacter sp. S4-A87 TaxID=2925843 RepID=UPI001F538724|nr:fimbrial protein [Lysobacter sp. S4-A87]UNK48142.1 fimbrial protein [Lysobacter sp. S4-A87]